jgi:hypothetical protein
MKKTIAHALLLALLLALVSCPSSNGHAPFDVLTGRIDLNQALIDNGLLDLVYPTQVSYYSSSVYRSSAASISIFLMNGSSSTYTFKSTDTVEFFYTEFSNLQGLYQTNASSGSTGVKYQLSSAFYGLLSAGEASSGSVMMTVPTGMISGRKYYLGALTRVNGKEGRVSVSDPSQLALFTVYN